MPCIRTSAPKSARWQAARKFPKNTWNRSSPSWYGQDLSKACGGAQGGYRLTRDPSEYTVGMILRLTEGSLSPVACLDDPEQPCHRSDICATLDVWKQLSDAINQVVDHVTLADLVTDQISKTGASL